MTKDNPVGDDAALKKRLDALTKTLDEKRQETEDASARARKGSNEGIGKAMGTGFRVATELVAATLVGGGIGYMLDKAIGTSPWFLLIFLLLGIAAGFWNVYKLAARPSGLPSPEEK